MIQETKIIKSSKSWEDLDLKINELVQRKKSKLAGSVFELLSKLYFKIAPEYKTKFKNVYLLNEVPNKLKRKLNLPNTDEGIDLIAETKNNEYWAIQCKYRSNKNETLKIKGDLATFNNLAFTNCKNISHGIVCTTINKPPKKIKLLKSIGFELLNTWTGLDKNDSELFKQIKDFLSGKIKKPKKLNPKPHQKKAINKTLAFFKSNNRGKIIMPCGTGKSLTAFWIAKKLNVKSILVCVPSLSLLQQTLKVWTREFLLYNIEPDWLCVCSDETVKEKQDNFVTYSSDLGIKVDTNPIIIKKFLDKKSELKIIFTTYQSGKNTALGSKGFRYDLGIMDEAHKTVGSSSKLMAHLIDDNNIKIQKRLFMTATERIFKGESNNFLSMDNIKNYGKLIYELSFKEAINSNPKIISDYKVITFGISNPEIEEITQSNKYLEVKKVLKDITARELATALALRKAIKKLKIKNALSFHRSIKRAENFKKQQETISQIYPKFGKLNTFHVRGDMPTSQRTNEMTTFENEKGLMTNARCLTEGVDLPAIDCVCFTDPKKSKIDIVQAAGRALRLSKGKKFGYILIPILTSNKKNTFDSALDQGFDDVATTVRALATSDRRIVDYLKLVSEGKKPKGGNPIDGITSLNNLHRVDSEKFINSVNLKIWEKVAFCNWRSFEDAVNILEKYEFKNQDDYKNRRKQFKELLNIPAAADVIYSNEWRGWGYFLKSRTRSQAATIKEASKFAIINNIRSGTQWKKFIKNNKIPFNIPKSPDAFYQTRGVWTGWGNFLKTGRKIARKYDGRYNYAQLCKICKKNNIKSFREYKIFNKKNPSLGLPYSPRKHFKEYNNKSFYAPKFPSFKELKKIARINNIKTMNQWRSFYEINKFKLNLVREPHNNKFYKKDWIDTYDFLGVKKTKYNLIKCIKIIKKFNFKNYSQYIQYIKKNEIKDTPQNPKSYFTKHLYWPGWNKYLSLNKVEYFTYKEAKAYIINLKIKSAKDFSNKKNTFDNRIPKAIELYYKKTNEWKGWHVFLDKKQILKFDEAKKFIKKYKFTKLSEYQKYIKKNKIEFLPLVPHITYSKNYKGSNDYLGTNYTTKDSYMSFKESRKFARSLNLKSSLQWRNLKKNKKIKLPKNLSLRVVARDEFKGWKDFLGKSYIGNDSEMITYDMAKKIVKKLKINSAKDYNKLNIKIKNKYKIPSNPYLSYKKNWRGWIDFLGK